MKVSDIMVRTAVSCTAEANLGQAVELMWNRNCGILPVVNEGGKVTGVVTDRDICIALGTRNRLPGQVTVREVAGPELHFCRPEDEVHLALEKMAATKVRRLPVVNNAGKLEGILSMDDIVLHADLGNPARDPSAAGILNTLRAIYSSRTPQRARRLAVA